MGEAGYLTYTSGKKCDYLRSFYGVMDSVNGLIKRDEIPTLGELLKGVRTQTEFLLEEARRHRARGVTAEMFFGCFKTLLHSVEDVVLGLEIPAEEKLNGVLQLRRACDLMETVCAGEWGDSSADVAMKRLQESNRRQTIEKNKYENIVSATGGLVLVVDPEGRVVEANPDARKYFPGETLDGSSFWETLGLPVGSVEEAFLAYPSNQTHEVPVLNGKFVFNMRIVPLSDLSLAKPGALLILSDITGLARHRDGLESRVMDRTKAWANSERLFRSIFEAAGDGIMLVDEQGIVVKANHQADEIYGVPIAGLVGAEIRRLVKGEGGAELVLKEIASRGRRSSVEVVGRRPDESTFPAQLTATGVKIDDQDFCHLIVRDISRQKALEDRLQEEKTQIEEMNVTLRNVLKGIDRERRELERSVANRIRTDLLPAVETLAREQDQHNRMSYAQILSDQLVGLTEGFEEELKPQFLKLSRTEIRICQYIRAGCASKEISEVMNVAFDTIQTHRRNIRRKLGLQGKEIGLYAFLVGTRSFPQSHPDS
jgi:PAS domain S-box-containing protein